MGQRSDVGDGHEGLENTPAHDQRRDGDAYVPPLAQRHDNSHCAGNGENAAQRDDLTHRQPFGGQLHDEW